MRILHVLDHSLPMLDGYAVRSKHVVEGQLAAGIEVAAVTAHMPGAEVPLEHEINGVQYYRTLPANPDIWLARLPLVSPRLRQRWLAQRLAEAAASFHPDLIHAHSPVLYGVPAQRRATRLKVPFVYEVRAFWEDAASEQGKYGHRSMKYRVVRWLETRLFRKAAAIAVIGERLRDEIAGRGIPRDTVFVAPNGVDAERFQPRPRNTELAGKLGLTDRVVIGYIGSFFGFEGVQVLLQAAPQIIEQAAAAAIVIVGGGKHEAELHRLAQAAKLPSDRLLLVGRVPFDQIIDYYALMDVLVYPRLSLRLTELVTPLKPLEAMAMAKPVIGSRVGGIEELVEHGRTGLLFEPGNAQALAAACVKLAGDADLRQKLGAAGREYVLRERQWPAIIPRYVDVYERLLRTR
jgi:glycogen(starch) synthase